MKKQDPTPGDLSPTSTVVAPATNPPASGHYLAKVCWRDTVDSSQWQTVEEINTVEVQQWGWVIFEDGEQLKLADTLMEGDWFGVTASPAGCIDSIQKIGD